MSTTLTNGLKLPDKGSVDWYADMQSNYAILDGAVGTVAEHTSQIAGKAADSAVVHKSENEIISGVKSFLDTNIRFNSNSYVSGTPSANIFYAPILIGGVVNNADKNTFQHNAAIRTTGINDYSIRVYSQTSNTLTGVVAETNADASNISFRPIADSTHNLGTSSYRWKTLNGINPGALSLPNLDSDGYIDLSDNISANSEYLYTPVYDGWLALYCQTTGFHAENAVGIFNRVDDTSYRWSNSVTSSINLLRYGGYHGSIILPVRAGIRYGCWVVVNSSTPLASSTLFFYKAKGNV